MGCRARGPSDIQKNPEATCSIRMYTHYVHTDIFRNIYVDIHTTVLKATAILYVQGLLLIREERVSEVVLTSALMQFRLHLPGGRPRSPERKVERVKVWGLGLGFGVWGLGTDCASCQKLLVQVSAC